MVNGWLLGVGSILMVLLPGLAVGAYTLNESMGSNLGRLVGAFIGGWIVGLIEEVLFRGALFEAARRVRGPLGAAIGVSLLFAVVHFISPAHPDGVVYGHATSGFSLLPHLIHYTSSTTYYFPFGLTLFLMSMVLCLIYSRQKHLYFIIGLHAGWVFMLQGGRALVDRNAEVWPLFFGFGENMARSWSAVLMLLVVGVFFLRKEQTG
jgi:hypothetical protein